MSKSVLSVLGAMIVDEDFEAAMKEDPQGTLARYGIALTVGEHEIVGQIVSSLRDDEFRGEVQRFRVRVCRVWPCPTLPLVPFERAGDYYSGGSLFKGRA